MPVLEIELSEKELQNKGEMANSEGAVSSEEQPIMLRLTNNSARQTGEAFRGLIGQKEIVKEDEGGSRVTKCIFVQQLQKPRIL